MSQANAPSVLQQTLQVHFKCFLLWARVSLWSHSASEICWALLLLLAPAGGWLSVGWSSYFFANVVYDALGNCFYDGCRVYRRSGRGSVYGRRLPLKRSLVELAWALALLYIFVSAEMRSRAMRSVPMSRPTKGIRSIFLAGAFVFTCVVGMQVASLFSAHKWHQFVSRSLDIGVGLFGISVFLNLWRIPASGRADGSAASRDKSA